MKYNLSYWEWKQYAEGLDYIIIGGGLVGMTAAIGVRRLQPNAKIVVLERGAVSVGASTRNAGFACFGSLSEIDDDLKEGSAEKVFELIKKRYDGLGTLRKLLGDTDLGFEAIGSREIFLHSQGELYQKCIELMPRINQFFKEEYGEDGVFDHDDDEIRKFGFGQVSHMIKNRLEGQLDTGLMMMNLYKLAVQEGILFLFGSEVVCIDNTGNSGQVALKNGWELKSKQIIVATNAFVKDLLPTIKVTAVRNQVLVTNPINLPWRASFHCDRGYYYFRKVGNRILLGGGRHLFREEETTGKFGTTENVQNELEAFLTKVISPGCHPKIAHRWSGILGVGDVKLPIVKRIGESLIIAVRMGGMGVAIGARVGEDAATIAVGSGQ